MNEENNDPAQLIETPLDLSSQLPEFSELLPDQLAPYWKIVQHYPLVEAGIIILLFWCLAYIIRRFALNTILRVTRKTKTNLDDRIIEQLRRPIFSTIFLLGVVIAVNSAGLTNGVLQYISPVFGSLIIITWLRSGLSLISIVMQSLSNDSRKFRGIDKRMEPLLIICSKILIILIACYILLLIWGINPVGLLASAGIVGIAVGFAAKDTLANLFSGVFILADTPYKLGDYINLDSGERGKVSHIGIRSTRLLTRDDIEITIPNGVIGNAKVINESGGPWKKMRLRLNVQCAYDANLDQVCEVLNKVAHTQTEVCNHPAARVRMRGFADSGINFQLLCWIDDPQDRGRILHELYMATHKAFTENGLEIPYPKRDVVITSSEAG